MDKGSNIKDLIEERLWNVVKRNYLSDNYNSAILDAIQFIGDIIREKSGLDSDGHSLIGSAFGGNNPKIKLNNLKTETEKNIQKGIESIFRGIYSAFRNPRSHSKIEDTEQQAFEIIIFLNHLLKIIDKSRGRFSIDIFMQRVFDDDFVPTPRYADLLIAEIPENKNFDVAIEIFKEKDAGKIYNLKYLWEAIRVKLTDKEQQEIIDLASQELRHTDSLHKITQCIGLFDKDWKNLDEDVRLRSENKLIKILPYSEKNSFGQLNEFARYSTWFITIISDVSLMSELAETVYECIASNNRDNQRFILDYFGRHLDKLEPNLFLANYDNLLVTQLQYGNPIIYSFINKLPNTKKIKFDEALRNFVDIDSKDSLPF